MKIVVLNGATRLNGTTTQLVENFVQGAESSGHQVARYDLAFMNVQGFQGGVGSQQADDDFNQVVLPSLQESEGLVLASPIYFYAFSSQLYAAIQRTQPIGRPAKLEKMGLLLSSMGRDVYEAVTYQYQRSMVDYWGVEDVGIVKSRGSRESLEEAYDLGTKF